MSPRRIFHLGAIHRSAYFTPFSASRPRPIFFPILLCYSASRVSYNNSSTAAMPPTLRKRKAPEPAPAPAPPAKRAAPKAKVAKVAAKAKAAVKETVKPAKAGKAAPAVNGSAKPAVDAAVAAAAAAVAPAAPADTPAASKGDTVALEGFGGEIETHDGKKTTLKALVDESEAGVVLFTYPKASTPGCTNQACLFRDSHEPLTAGGLAIYGLSADTPKENTRFKEKQKLPYPLLCDPKATLLAAIGLKKGPAKAARGVFVVDKAGRVLAAQTGSPAGTVDVVRKLVAEAAAEPEEAAAAEEAVAAAKEKNEDEADEAEKKD
ncbi:thioredoxin peroxidase [Gaeumannomyces tritici R3-111a-1]|uniref:thioredoxin-dependent peroxiredoxin n=1 Tax=Gaeumannomyces tritici (strain R3-111a-1) TaxID=644352 RepID=J3P8U0_GAET3|nr:thioredoxin peroxidase [Gaeumannomyces tritici R3-111a-1]EJT73074.1 thioredoxin peroxidase [Gaeumannomyces tritici R3-111a-1]